MPDNNRTSTDANREDAQNGTTNSESVFNPIVPQDKTGRTSTIFGRLTLGDIGTTLIPPALLFLVLTDYAGAPVGWSGLICIVLTAALGTLCWHAPYYLKPTELLKRNYRACANRLKMPLVHEAAWEIPGIRDLFWGWDAIAREDETIVGAVEVGAVPSESFDKSEQFVFHHALAMAFNSKIERVDGGFDVQLHCSQFTTTPLSFGELDDRLDDSSTYDRLNEYEREFASARADHGYRYLNESGVMDRAYRIIVPVGPDEGDNVGWIEARIRKHLSTLGLTDLQRVSQLRLLDRRIDQVLSVAGMVGGGRRLSTADLVGLQRDHWQGRNTNESDPSVLNRSRTVASNDDFCARAPDRAVDVETLRECPGEPIRAPLVDDRPPSRVVERDHDRRAEPRRKRGVPPAGSTDREAITYREEHAEEGIRRVKSAPKRFASEAGSRVRQAPDAIDSTTDSAADRLQNAREKTNVLIESGRLFARSIAQSFRRHTDSDTRALMYDVYAPTEVEATKGTLTLCDEAGEPLKYARSYMIAHLPTKLPYGVLDPIDTLPGVDLDRSVHVRATDRQEKRDDLDDKRDDLVNNAKFKEMFGRADIEDTDALAVDTIELYEHLRDGVEAVEASITVTVRAGSKQDLRERCTALKNVCATNNIELRNPKRQLSAFKSVAPLADDHLHENSDIPVPYDMPTDSVGNLSSYPGYVRQDDGGRIMGFVKTDPGDSPVVDVLQVDRLALTSPHIVSIGRSGAGKTAAENEGVIEECLRNPDWKTVISDVAQGFHGVEAVHHDRSSRVKPPETTINLFEYDPPEGEGSDPHAAFDLWVQTIASALMIQVKDRGGSDATDLRDTLTDAIRETFRWSGLTRETAGDRRSSYEVPEDIRDAMDRDDIELDHDDLLADTVGEDEASHSGHPGDVSDSGHQDHPRHPTMADLFYVFDYMTDYPARFVRDREAYTDRLVEQVEALYMHLRAFEQGNQYDFLNGQGEVDLNADTLIFDLSHYEEDDSVIKAILNVVKTATAYNAAKGSDRRVLLVEDEAHDVLYDSEEAEKLATLLRAGRNHGLMFTAISQATKDFLQGPGSIFIDQASCVIVHEVGNKDASLASEIGLTEEKEQLVRNRLETGDKGASEYAEALVILEQGREVYLVEKRYPEAILDMCRFKQSEHGDFDLFLAGVPRDEQDDYHIEYRDGERVAVRNAAAAVSSPEQPTTATADGGQEVHVPRTISEDREGGEGGEGGENGEDEEDEGSEGGR